MAKPQHSAEERKELLALARELTRLRNANQRATVVRIKQGRHTEENRKWAERRERETAREEKFHATCERINEVVSR